MIQYIKPIQIKHLTDQWHLFSRFYCKFYRGDNGNTGIACMSFRPYIDAWDDHIPGSTVSYLFWYG